MVPLCGSFITIWAPWCQRKCVYTSYGDQGCSTMFSRCDNSTKRGVSPLSDPWGSGEDNTPSSCCRILVLQIYTIIHALALYTRNMRIICTYNVYRVLYTRTISTLFWILCFFGHRHCCCTAFSFGWPNKCQGEKRVTKCYHNVWSNTGLLVFIFYQAHDVSSSPKIKNRIFRLPE